MAGLRARPRSPQSICEEKRAPLSLFPSPHGLDGCPGTTQNAWMYPSLNATQLTMLDRQRQGLDNTNYLSSLAMWLFQDAGGADSGLSERRAS